MVDTTSDATAAAAAVKSSCCFLAAVILQRLYGALPTAAGLLLGAAGSTFLSLAAYHVVGADSLYISGTGGFLSFAAAACFASSSCCSSSNAAAAADPSSSSSSRIGCESVAVEKKAAKSTFTKTMQHQRHRLLGESALSTDCRRSSSRKSNTYKIVSVLPRVPIAAGVLAAPLFVEFILRGPAAVDVLLQRSSWWQRLSTSSAAAAAAADSDRPGRRAAAAAASASEEVAQGKREEASKESSLGDTVQETTAAQAGNTQQRGQRETAAQQKTAAAARAGDIQEKLLLEATLAATAAAVCSHQKETGARVSREILRIKLQAEENAKRLEAEWMQLQIPDMRVIGDGVIFLITAIGVKLLRCIRAM